MIQLLILLLACAAPALLVMLVLYVRLCNRLVATLQSTDDGLENTIQTVSELLESEAPLCAAPQVPQPAYFPTPFGFVSAN